jgi:foldase protein PrsA
MPTKKKIKIKSVENINSLDKLPETEDAKRRRRKTNAIISASAILAFIIAVSVAGWYLGYKLPFQATIIQVNDEKISIDYLLKRCLMNTDSASDTMGTIQSILQELVIKQVAIQPPYNIQVTEADIDQELRNQANSILSTDNTTDTTTTPTPAQTLSDAEFQEWYRQTLNQSQLTEKQFRDLVRVSLLGQRIYTYLADRMATSGEQVHVYDIVLPDSVTAADVKQRIDNGEDFMTIAREMSLDGETSEKGGDMGWLPIHVLDSNLEYTVERLEIGKVSDPVQTSTAFQEAQSSQQEQSYYLLMVTEKDAARAYDAQYIPYLKSRLLQDWLNETMTLQKISLRGKGASGGYDSQTNAWLLYQIEKRKASRGITSTTTSTTPNPLTGQ